MRKRRIVAALCAAALIFSLTACSANEQAEITDAIQSGYRDTTLTGQVTAIDGGTVTLQLGELNATSPNGGTMPEMPEGGDGGGMPTGEAGGTMSDSQTPPEKPDGDTSGEAPADMPTGMSNDGQTPPEKQNDANSGEEPADMPTGEMPEGMGEEQPGAGGAFTAGDETVTLDLTSATFTKNGESVTLEEIAVGDILVVEFDSDGNASATVQSMGGMDMPSGQNGQGSFGGSGEVTQGTAATTIDTDGSYSDASYTSTGDDENALRIDSAEVTLSGVTVDKSAGASSNTEDGDFYGMNAALLATNGATVTIENATVTSSAQNGNGVFSYGDGTVVNISDSTITTSADNSGGIQTTGGGTTNANNLIVQTSGNSSAAIRSDRGGGTVNVDGGTYTSNGLNSPAVYSTAAITVRNATLTANNSEALVIEGQNSITLENCDVYGNMSDTEGTSSDENVHTVMIYQSMSGDAEVGTSEFSMTGGTLLSNNGDIFYITNTRCVLTLSGVEITNHETDEYLLRVCGNSASHGWGTAGANGAQVTFTADGQTLTGDIAVDTISTLTMTLTNGSSFTGTICILENAAGGTAVDDNAAVTVGEGCTWTLTGDCTLTSLVNNGTINFNGYTITLADGTVLSA